MADIIVKGYANNVREAIEIHNDDLLGVQDGSSLFNMKKIKWEVLLKATRDYLVIDQIAASSHWIVDHNLHKFPSVTIIDSAGTIVMGDVQYVSDIQITIDFSVPFSGSVYLN